MHQYNPQKVFHNHFHCLDIMLARLTPDEKLPPAPLTITVLTASSSLKALSVPPKRPHNSASKALILSGRFNVSTFEELWTLNQ